MHFSLRWKPNRNVLLIIPELSRVFPNHEEDYAEADVLHPPLGVLYLSSSCRAAGYQPVIVDQLTEKAYDDEKLIKLIESMQINIVGISCTMTASFNASLRYAKLCKALGCVTVFGGAHVSATIQNTAEKDCCDIVVFGEREKTWVKLLESLNGGQDIHELSGIAFQDNYGKVLVGQRRPLIQNLDNIPFPDYDNINMHKYITQEALGMITSRGCTNRCIFCTSHCTWGQQVRFRTPQNILHELDWLVEKYDYDGKELLFYDDNFTLKRGRVLEFCRRLLRRNYQVHWKCMSRVNGIDSELVAAMKEAGCESISFGFESGTEKSLKLMKKGITLKDTERVIDLCTRSGMKVNGYFIIGFPWETKADFEATVNFIISHPEIDSALNFLTPYPGTAFYCEPELWGISVDEDWDRFTNLSVVMRSPNFTEQDLYDAYTKYLLFMEENQNETE